MQGANLKADWRLCFFPFPIPPSVKLLYNLAAEGEFSLRVKRLLLCAGWTFCCFAPKPSISSSAYYLYYTAAVTWCLQQEDHHVRSWTVRLSRYLGVSVWSLYGKFFSWNINELTSQHCTECSPVFSSLYKVQVFSISLCICVHTVKYQKSLCHHHYEDQQQHPTTFTITISTKTRQHSS